MKKITKYIISIIVGSAIILFAAFDSPSADIRTPSTFYSMPNMVLYGGYFALGIGTVGIIQEFRKKRKFKKKS